MGETVESTFNTTTKKNKSANSEAPNAGGADERNIRRAFPQCNYEVTCTERPASLDVQSGESAMRVFLIVSVYNMIATSRRRPYVSCKCVEPC